MRSTLRIRLTLWYLGVLATVIVAFSAGFYALLSKNFRTNLDSGLRSAAEVTALALNHETEEHLGKLEGEESVRLVLNTMHQTSFPRPDIAVWYGGTLVAEKPGLAGLPAAVVASRIRGIQYPGGYNYSTLEERGTRYRLVVANIWVPSSKAQYLVVANESMTPLESEMGAVGEILLGTVPVCLILAAVGGYFLARKSLTPVLAMAQKADHITSRDLDERIPVEQHHDEFGLLADSFNRVLDRLQDTFRQQRQFMADASHELRTPMSVALTATQVSLEGRPHSREELIETLEVVQSQMLRLRRIVEDMFMLAQADSGVFGTTVTTFYLDEIVQESIRAGRVLGAARGVEVRVGESLPEAEFTGDEGLLRQLLLILVDNAVKYTPSGELVEVWLSSTSTGYRLRVADSGTGVAPADQPYIFDRFYRADKGRSRRQSAAGGGAGLGLAIARWITQLHGGSVWLEHSDSRGSVFCVDLPVEKSPVVAEGAKVAESGGLAGSRS